jgi:zona occludens toxin
MSLLISAPIRTGKTLYTMKLIFEYLNKGRQVYTNIVGIKVDGVISVASSINDPFDWRDLPNGSVVVWDEAHEHPSFSEQDLLKTFKIDETPFDELLQSLNSKDGITATQERANIQKIEKAKKDALEKRKEEIRDIGRSLLLHGHFGIEIIFITQRPAKLNADVLASVTSHFVMRRKFGMDAAMIWEFGEALTTWSRTTATYALNKTLWRYPKHLYKFYVSSENHQVRKSFPLKYVAFACIPLILFYIGFNNAQKTGFMGLFKKEEQVQQQTTNPQQQQQATAQQSDGVVICTYQNINTPECQALQQAKNEKLNQEVKASIVHYNTNDPYLSYSTTKIDIEVDPSQLPRLSGCVKYKGRFYGIDQQGNKMPNIREEACRRWIDDGARPFNYFADQQQYRSDNTNSGSSLKIVQNEQNDSFKNMAQQSTGFN